MNDEVSTAITAPGDTVLRDEAHGVETEEEILETEEGSVEAEEATLSALYNYLLATDGSSERYPTGYNKEQKRGLRRKAKRFTALTLPRWRSQVQFQLCCFIHSWFLYFSKYLGSRSRKGSCFTRPGRSYGWKWSWARARGSTSWKPVTVIQLQVILEEHRHSTRCPSAIIGLGSTTKLCNL